MNALGYPGFANPDLVIKSAFEPESILTQNASVHYALRDPGEPARAEPYATLPDKYNGLGFKNLIYMVITVLDYYNRWASEEEDRPPLHLVMIEEPEVHFHVQLQRVFIQKIREIVPNESPGFISQLIVTTHSPHIIYESSFQPIRYFRRFTRPGEGNCSEVVNLSTFCGPEKETRDFLLQYMKVTHCDLFFADAAVLVEGNVERLLLPLMIEKAAPELMSCYLSILELGGAFAHVFSSLIHFLGVTTLVITDLDSVLPMVPAGLEAIAERADRRGTTEAGDKQEDEEIEDETEAGSACSADTENAVTSNQTLIKWLPRLTNIAELLAADRAVKAPAPKPPERAKVCVAFQTRHEVVWQEKKAHFAGRTFEEAFAYENIQWCQDLKQKDLRLRVITKKKSLELNELTMRIHERVKSRSFKKTQFALALMMKERRAWTVPRYIAEGLVWLSGQLIGTNAEPGAATKATEVATHDAQNRQA